MTWKKRVVTSLVLPTEETLDTWLTRMLSEDVERSSFMSFCFPTDAIALAYLDTIHTRSADEVLRLAAALLDGIESIGQDATARCHLIESPDLREVVDSPSYEYRRRLIRSIGGNSTPRDGISWVLRLAERAPRMALDALRAYSFAHFAELPDWRISGLGDVEALIRHRFVARANEGDVPTAALASLAKRDFEYLVAELYERMGFEAAVGTGSRDGGIDVVATKSAAGARRRIAVQCKLPDKRNVSVKVVRELLGVAARPDYTSCAVVTSGRFTQPARAEFRDDHRVELIDGNVLRVLMNEHFGLAWPRQLPTLIGRRSARGQAKERSALSGPASQ